MELDLMIRRWALAQTLRQMRVKFGREVARAYLRWYAKHSA